jgi:hypothetical protein
METEQRRDILQDELEVEEDEFASQNRDISMTYGKSQEFRDIFKSINEHTTRLMIFVTNSYLYARLSQPPATSPIDTDPKPPGTIIHTA